MADRDDKEKKQDSVAGCLIFILVAIAVVGAVFIFGPGLLATALLRSSLLADWDTAQMWTFGIATSVGIWLALLAITRAWRTASLVYLALCVLVLASFLFALFGLKSTFAQRSSVWYFPQLAATPAQATTVAQTLSVEQPTAVAATTAAATTFPPTPTVTRETLYTTIGIARGDTLKVRSGPGANYPIVENLSNGIGGLRVVGGPVMNDTTEWVQISFAEQSGWVARRYLTPERFR